MPASVVLADDHPLLRKGLRGVLEATAEFTVAAETGSGLEALRLVEAVHPDVLVLDLMMPGLSGLDVLPIVRQRAPRTRVVIFSMSAADELVLRALRSGAIGYVVKGCEASHLEEAVRSAAEGRRYLSPPISERAFEAFCERAEAAPADPHDLLTPRERETLQLSAEGRSCAEVGDQLSISPRTAEMHRASAMRKLGLKRQTDLIRYALRRGMLGS